MPSAPVITNGTVFPMAMVSIRVPGGNKTDILLKTLQRILWCLALFLPVSSLMFRLTSELQCWGKDRDQVVVLDSLMTIVREVVALVSGVIYHFTRPPHLELPVSDSFGRRLRVSCHLGMLASVVLYIPHLFKTFLWFNTEALLTLLFLCVDVGYLDFVNLSNAIFVGDYIGFMAANALISWVSLRYALGLAALRAELLSQPRCSLSSVLRRRRRLARHFAVPLLLWGCNSAVGVTIAFRQCMISVGMLSRGLWALLIYYLFQVVHNVWTLVLVAWAAGSLKRSLSDALRARGQHAAPLMSDNPDALDFFSPDGRCLVRLLSASLGYGVVLYQLTVPYILAVPRTKPPADYASCGPRYC